MSQSTTGRNIHNNYGSIQTAATDAPFSKKDSFAAVEFNDPQKALGAGISSYHQQLAHLSCLFLFMVLIHIPVILIYNNYDYFRFEDGLTQGLGLSLGNMGFSESRCLVDTIYRDSVDIQCSTGAIASVSDVGITTRFEDQQACSRKDTTQYCYQFFRGQKFNTFFKNTCVGQKECSINNIGQFLQDDVDSSLLSICMNVQSRFFI